MTGQAYGESVEYMITNCSFPSGNEENFLNYFNTIKQNTAFYIEQKVGTATKNNPIRITQLYIEITYTTPDATTTTYIKTNGSWAETPITIYEKNNSSWITSNLSNLTTKKYILKEVP